MTQSRTPAEVLAYWKHKLAETPSTRPLRRAVIAGKIAEAQHQQKEITQNVVHTAGDFMVTVLMLNPMTGRSDYCEPVAAFTSDEKMDTWYKAQFAESAYRDEGRWNKVFKKGSALEWFNPLGVSPKDYIWPMDSSYVFGCVRRNVPACLEGLRRKGVPLDPC